MLNERPSGQVPPPRTHFQRSPPPVTHMRCSTSVEVNKTNARHGCFANELKNVTRETFRTGNIFGPARANEVIAILDALTVQPTKDFRQNIIIPNPALLEEQALKPAWSYVAGTQVRQLWAAWLCTSQHPLSQCTWKANTKCQHSADKGPLPTCNQQCRERKMNRECKGISQQACTEAQGRPLNCYHAPHWRCSLRRGQCAKRAAMVRARLRGCHASAAT